MYFVIYHTPDNEKDLVVNTERLMVCAKPDTEPGLQGRKGFEEPRPTLESCVSPCVVHTALLH